MPNVNRAVGIGQCCRDSISFWNSCHNSIGFGAKISFFALVRTYFKEFHFIAYTKTNQINIVA